MLELDSVECCDAGLPPWSNRFSAPLHCSAAEVVLTLKSGTRRQQERLPPSPGPHLIEDAEDLHAPHACGVQELCQHVQRLHHELYVLRALASPVF